MIKKVLLIVSFILFTVALPAQDRNVKEEKTGLDTVSLSEKNAQEIGMLQKQLKGLQRLKISGYVQVQWQIGQGEGQPGTFTGGNFPGYSDNRFMTRRGRLKFDYTYGIFNGVLQIDATEKGVKLKDSYISVTAPSSVAGITVGVFNRPFGHEIAYSSSMRETPERTRMYQALFPDERDIGAKISLRGKRDTWLNHFNFEGGLFVGNGINPEVDSRKDFIGRLGYAYERNGISLGLGVSAYIGGVLNTQSTGYSFDSHTKAFVERQGVEGSYSKRHYFGGDIQFSAPTILGKTALRGEVIGGKQPGLKNSDMSPKKEITEPVYNRQFIGYVLYWVQNIGKSNFSTVVRLDYFDPNRKIKGDEIGVEGTGTGKGDIAYTTLGVGAAYEFKKIFKIMAYYDFVWNEKSQNLYSADKYDNFMTNIKDNLFTLRLQLTF